MCSTALSVKRRHFAQLHLRQLALNMGSMDDSATELALNLEGHGYADGDQGSAHPASAARVGVLRHSEVWTRANQRIEEAAGGEEATLNPRRGWHSGPVVWTLKQTQERVAGLPWEVQRACTEQESRQVVRALRGPQIERSEAL